MLLQYGERMPLPCGVTSSTGIRDAAGALPLGLGGNSRDKLQRLLGDSPHAFYTPRNTRSNFKVDAIMFKYGENDFHDEKF